MTTWRAVVLSMLVAGVAAAQVQVNSGGNTVTVSPGGAVDVQKGGKNVKVKTGGTTVQVQGTDDDGDAKDVEVKTGGGATTVKSAPGETDADEAQGSTQRAVDGKWMVDGMGRTETHACAPNEDVVITGQGHVITLTGPCRNINVSGQSNQVKTDVAASIQASGMSNSVGWKAGAGGKKPKVALSGMGNSAKQMK
jgi:hypothetical protein